MSELFHRIEDPDELASLLESSDEEILVTLRRPTLIRLAPTDSDAPARFVACLLHGNEDSGYRAVLRVLRRARQYPFELIVLIGNVRAATTDGWFAHRYLDDQEDFNRVWGLNEPTTRMRRCADALLAELWDAELEGGIDLHNNTGESPPYVIVPRPDPDSLALAGLLDSTAVLWHLRANTLMQVLGEEFPVVAVECGPPGHADQIDHAEKVLDRFLDAPPLDTLRGEPQVMYRMLARVEVRTEVPFVFGGPLSEEIDLVLEAGLDSANNGMLLAGTRIGRVHPGAGVPLVACDMHGREVTERYFAVHGDGALVLSCDVTPMMMTRTVRQTRRDCLFYIGRRYR